MMMEGRETAFPDLINGDNAARDQVPRMPKVKSQRVSGHRVCANRAAPVPKQYLYVENLRASFVGGMMLIKPKGSYMQLLYHAWGENMLYARVLHRRDRLNSNVKTNESHGIQF